MEKAKEIDKLKPHYLIDYANLLLMQESITQNTLDISKKNIGIAESLAKYNFDLLNKIFIYNITKIGDIDKSLELLNKLQELRPHWDYTWELSYTWYWNIIEYYTENNLDFSEVLKISLSKLDSLKETMKGSKSPVKLNSETLQYIIQKIIYFNNNDYDFKNAEETCVL
jgi:hypothetical protein